MFRFCDFVEDENVYSFLTCANFRRRSYSREREDYYRHHHHRERERDYREREHYYRERERSRSPRSRDREREKYYEVSSKIISQKDSNPYSQYRQGSPSSLALGWVNFYLEISL